MVPETTVERARSGDDRAFGELTEPYRGELQLHCYRILGSVQDAEDVLQETLLAAWRGLGQYERERDVATRFATAFAADDIDSVVALLTDDAWFTMPPVTLEYQGPEAIAGFLRDVNTWLGPRRYRLIPTRANGQPAFGFYLQEGQSPVFRAHGLIVLTLEGGQISAITRFVDNSNLARFGLLPMLAD